MSMFDNIVLDEFTMLDEGKQADEYRARKDKEKEDAKNFGKERFTKNHGTLPHFHTDSDGKQEERYNTGNKMTKENPNNSWKHPIKKAAGKKADIEYQKDVEAKSMKKGEDGIVRSQGWRTDGERNTSRYTGDYQRDAIARHMRRHPKTESALMLIAGYESEYAY